LSAPYDVVVVGGGNAGICAAIAARESGAQVLVLEAAPKEFRGGNSRHTRNLRAAHDAPSDILTDSYTAAEYFDDIVRVTHGKTNHDLAQIAIRASGSCRAWMEAKGVRFQPSLRGTLHLSRTNAFFLGGGKALLNSYYLAAKKLGITVLYDAEVRELQLKGAQFSALVVAIAGSEFTVRAKTLIVASGGFEANISWLREIWGAAADNFVIRGTPFNRGILLRALLKGGASVVGDADQCHAVAVDARSPQFDGGIVTRLDCVTLGIVVNNRAERFYDEGEDFWPKRYAIWGRLVAQQPDQIAYTIIDSRSFDHFMPSVYPPIEASSIPALAAQLQLDSDKLRETILAFNAAITVGTFDHTSLDDCRTRDLMPKKSHWARPIDKPPFWAYPLRPGITFTYLGVKVNERAEVIFGDGVASPNIFAAGEIMAGNVLGEGYLSGLGMTIGTTFGRIAGYEAGRYVHA
jgi:tricarballylate dehydrogenase